MYATDAERIEARRRQHNEASARYQKKKRALLALQRAEAAEVPGANVLVYGVDCHGRVKIVRKCMPFQSVRVSVSGWFVDLQRALWPDLGPTRESLL